MLSNVVIIISIIKYSNKCVKIKIFGFIFCMAGRKTRLYIMLSPFVRHHTTVLPCHRPLILDTRNLAFLDTFPPHGRRIRVCRCPPTPDRTYFCVSVFFIFSFEPPVSFIVGFISLEFRTIVHIG